MPTMLPPVPVVAQTFYEDFAHFQHAPDGITGCNPSPCWMTTYPYGGEAARTLPSNDEAEYYSDSTVGRNPFLATEGKAGVMINAKPVKPGENPYNLPYTSGLLTTFTSFAQTYGYFEVKVQLPAGQGLWPAFWMLPASNQYTAELDIFEMLGNQPTVIYSTTHGDYDGTWGTDFQPFTVPDTSAAMHVYGVDWEPDYCTFYMDNQVLGSAPTPDSMNTPMYILLNLAVGGAGSWPGAPDASTRFPAHMTIKAVAAYATANTQAIVRVKASVQPR